ncbi:MAG: hypothetical protein HC855_06280 [Rhizobiales bacterium]|nr:hypothetical protein [Hyphomicrobiales bacterium]
MPSADATRDAKNWLLKLETALRNGDADSASKLFGTECYWRDLLAFTWNIRTVEGQGGIRQLLAATLPHVKLQSLEMEGAAERAGEIVEAWFRFETAVARGIGHLRLKGGKGYTLLTTMQELKGHEEKQGPSREKGLVHGAFRDRKAWHEERAREQAELSEGEQREESRRCEDDSQIGDRDESPEAAAQTCEIKDGDRSERNWCGSLKRRGGELIVRNLRMENERGDKKPRHCRGDIKAEQTKHACRDAVRRQY